MEWPTAVEQNASMSSDATVYRELRTTTIAVARAHLDDLECQAPATPAWRARDVLAHLAGVCDDVVNGNLAGVATDDWTAVQVDKRRPWEVDEVLTDWERHGVAVDALIDQAPPGTFGQLLFDAWTHEQDLRAALGVPGGRESEASLRSLDFATTALDGRDRGQSRPALTLIANGVPRDVGVSPATTTLRASRFELLRAMTGRRSTTQVRSWDWTGEPDPARLLLAPFFRPPAQDVRE
jgi:uncharacterized protein (TIGR03083 family)